MRSVIRHWAHVARVSVGEWLRFFSPPRRGVMVYLHTAAERRRMAERARDDAASLAARLRSYGLADTSSVLDLGCGPGLHTVALARAAHSGSVVGLDRDPQFVVEARARLKRAGCPHARVVRGTADVLEFDDAAFDLVYARALFQHLAQPLSVLREVRRILRPGGWCVIDEIDRGWFMTYPESAEFVAVRQRIEAAQMAAGGDPYVGRKLASYLHRAGLCNATVAVTPAVWDGRHFPGFVTEVAPSLLQCVAEPERTASRCVLDAWAAAGAAAPEQHRLYAAFFTAVAQR